MASKIEDYALIGDLHTAALVARDGSIDWMCLPRFDSGSVFAALVGTAEHGYWRVAPAEAVTNVTRRYRDGSLVLDTLFETAAGSVRLVDFMPLRDGAPTVVRIIEGVSGRVAMRMDLVVRPDYGACVPRLARRAGNVVRMSGGPDAFYCRASASIALRDVDHGVASTFAVAAGERHHVTLAWRPTHEPEPEPCDAPAALEETLRWWGAWSAKCTYRGAHRAAVLRSLITIKALTYAPTGGIVAAATTSLPEKIGGVRNWDYRYCWLRDATFSLVALEAGGYVDEALAWRDWLVNAVAGDAGAMQVMYGVAGERRLNEWEADWLPGYEGSAPVHIGNGAYTQRQLDVYGEAIGALFHARTLLQRDNDDAWAIETDLLAYLERAWREPDSGIWESRAAPRQYTHSKVMAWLAFDCAVKNVEWFGKPGPVERWRATRDAIRAEVDRRGYNATLNAYVNVYDGDQADASLLMLPLIGYLTADDPRMRGTVALIERTLLQDGLVCRYRAEQAEVDGLPPGEGAFLLCTFWLASNYAMAGRTGEAEALFGRLLALRNDVGLLAEEYDPRARRMLGNFPQAITHVGLIKTASKLDGVDPAPLASRGRPDAKEP